MSIYNEMGRKLSVTNAVIVNGGLWFCSAWYRYLFKCNLTTNKVEKIVGLPNDGDLFPSYVYLFYKNGCLYLITSNNKTPLIKYDIFSERIDVIDNKLECNEIGIFCDEDEEHIYIPNMNESRVICMRKEDLSVEEHLLYCKPGGIQLVKKIDDGFVVLEKGVGDVVILDNNYKEMQRITPKPKGYNAAYDNYYPGQGIVWNGDNITIFPRYANMVYTVSVSKNMAYQNAKRYLEYDNAEQEGPRFSCVKEMEGYVWVFSNKDNQWLIHDKQLNLVRKLVMSLSEEIEAVLDNVNVFKGVDVKVFNEYKHVYSLGNFIKSI